MNEIRTILETILIVISGHEITVAQVLIIPLVILTGYLILGWLIRFTVNNMLARGVNADVVQMVRRALFVTGLII